MSFSSKQKKIIEHYKNKKKYIQCLRFLQKNIKNKKKKLTYQLIIQKSLKKTYKTHFRKTCLITNRSRGVNAFMRLSRSQIKEQFSFKELLGILKSSW